VPLPGQGDLSQKKTGRSYDWRKVNDIPFRQSVVRTWKRWQKVPQATEGVAGHTVKRKRGGGAVNLKEETPQKCIKKKGVTTSKKNRQQSPMQQ